MYESICGISNLACDWPNCFHLSSSSGIGRAVAVLFAREGADISIVYLPEEQPDAEDTKKMVEKEGRQCLLIAGDLMDNRNCQNAVSKHVETWVFYLILMEDESRS